MARYIRSRWEPRFHGMTRRDRQGCSYNAYVPDPLVGWNLTLPSDLAADIADAETAIRDLNQAEALSVGFEGIARFLLRAESVASSKIEGLEAGPRRLVEAEAAIAMGGRSADRVAVEILGNIDAMESAIDAASGGAAVSLSDLLQIHQMLMARSKTPDFGGVVREEQNWIGGSSYNPCSAAYVPPPAEHVNGLLTDLLTYVNGDDHSPLVQAALSHAQFETIHPFTDGNGRSGRALIHVVLRRRSISPTVIPPISLVLATWADDYISGLTGYRHEGAADSTERSEAAHIWLRTFAGATLRACADAGDYAARIEHLTDEWRSELGMIRRGSALDLLIAVLPAVPLLTVESASRLISRSGVAASGAINRLLDAGILIQRNVGKQRYRIFEAPTVLTLFTSLERALASPSGDTASEPPIRPVPTRPPNN